MTAADPAALRTARAVARELAAAGARSVTLHGSHARGEAHSESDLDVMAIGTGPRYSLSRRSRLLVAVEWASLREERAALGRPESVGATVPGWREAIVLYDPEGLATRLQKSAMRFEWESIGADCDRWIAAEVTGFAEEVHKLVAAVESGRTYSMAVWRAVLALRLAKIMSVRRRILYGTENVMWDLVAEAMGEPWVLAQAAALSMRGEPLEESCRAALRLYAIAAGEAWSLLDRRQRAVVGHACEIAGWPQLDG